MSLDQQAPLRDLLDDQVYEADIEEFARQGLTRVKTVHLNGFMHSLERVVTQMVETRLAESLSDHKARLFDEVNGEVFAILEHAVRDAAYNALLVREREAEIEALRDSFREELANMRARVANFFQSQSTDPEQPQSDPSASESAAGAPNSDAAALESEIESCLEGLESVALPPIVDEAAGEELPEIGETFQANAKDAIEDILAD